MNILVLNGSPKGKYSVTLQTVRYLEILNPQHTFDVFDVGQKIRSIENDFSAAKEKLENADVIVFSYPVYTFIAPYQLHKFIELMKKSGVNLSGKYATQITTSKHFYDVTAHKYIQENCQDLGMKFIKGLSADMDDLTSEKGQKDAENFFNLILWSIENDVYEVAAEKPLRKPLAFAEVPEGAAAWNAWADDNAFEGKLGDVVILTDCSEENVHLQKLIARFRAIFPRKTRVVNILDYPFKGGCIGCFSCAVSGKCVYKDGFDDFLRNDIQKSEAIVYAFSVKDHSMGARFKLYDDRQFCNGHRTVTMGMPMGYLVNGYYSDEMNLKMIVEARAEVGNNFLAGVATDEVNPNAEVDKLAKTLSYALEKGYVPPQNFYGIGGMKIFRDLIWQMQGMMKADHKFYKAHGQYDFPQKHRGKMLAMYLVGAMLSSDKIKSKMGNKMNEGMVMPYKKALEKAEKRMQDAEKDK